MEKNKIEHAVIYAYNYEAYIAYFDTAEEAKIKVFSMVRAVQVRKIQFCENISATQDDIYELRNKVQDALNLLQRLSIAHCERLCKEGV